MMSTVPDEFDTILRGALDDVAAATQPDPGLADMLLANARSGRPVVVSLAARSQARRWMFPLIAVASVAALAIGAVVVSNLASDDTRVRPSHHHTSPAPQPPAPQPPTPTVVPQFHAYTVDFADPQHGWALGAAACPTGTRSNCATLVATADAGTSWRQVTLPKGLRSPFDSASCGDNGTVRGPCVDNVLFATASDGYLWGLHTIYRTGDGGRHWTQYNDPTHDWDGAARMIVAGDSVVRIAPVQQCSAGCPGLVESARVGTFDWRISHPTSQQVGLFNSNLAVSGSTVFLFAGGTEANPGTGIFRSDDGGNTWSPIATNPCGHARSPENDPFYASDGMVADDGSVVADCLVARGGIRVAAAGSSALSELRPFPRHGDFQLVGAQSAQQIVIADIARAVSTGVGQATFYATTDGGLHWQRTATIPSNADSAHFLPGGHGYAPAAGGEDLYVTDDGGATWRRLRFSS